MGKRKAEARDAYVIVSAERPPPPSHELSPAEKAYVKWMKRRGIVLNGVGVGRFPRTGRGCVATRDIAPGDVLVSVPEDAIITAETSVAADALTKFGLGGDEMSAEASPRLEREALVLAVLAEMSRGHESDFAPYLAALPTLRATHSPLAWSGAELAELEGTSALDHLMQMEDEALELPSMTAEHWRHVARPFLEANPEFARAPGGVRRRRDAGEDDDDIDDEEGDEADDDEADAEVLEAQKMYLHAAALVAGFSFTLGGDDDDDDDDASDSEGGGGGGGGGTTQAMVPFWDMLNHASPLDASVRLTHDPDARELRMVATKRVPAGAEVFNTYGPLGDAELLRRYGFTLRKNPHGGGVECGVRELMAAASMARYTAETAEIHRFADDPEDRDADDDADDSDEDSDEDSESDSDSDDDDDDEDDETDDEYDLGIGEVSRKDMMDRLRWLRRRGILSNSRDKFYVSRTGRPSVALRHAVRVLSMHRFQFGVLRAADAYERGERDDQTGAYSDEDDEDDEDGFGGAKPMTTSQIWDGAGVGASRAFDARAFFFVSSGVFRFSVAGEPSDHDTFVGSPSGLKSPS